jgi:hypothetical protein
MSASLTPRLTVLALALRWAMFPLCEINGTAVAGKVHTNVHTEEAYPTAQQAAPKETA